MSRQQSFSKANEPSADKPSSKVGVSKPALKPHPPVENKPTKIVRAWTALEVLSPQTYTRESQLVPGDSSRLVRINDGQLPWITGEKSRPKKRLYYELIVGSLAVNSAIEALFAVYIDKRPDRSVSRGWCPIARIMLDKSGIPLAEDSAIAISSFAWGVPVALAGDLNRLDEWPENNIRLIAW